VEAAGDAARVFFDGREMAELSEMHNEIEILDNGVRVVAETLRLPEGTLLHECDAPFFKPNETPQWIFYAQGRVACAWRGDNGATVMVFGDSPKEALNNAVARDAFSWMQIPAANATPAAQRAAEILQRDGVRFLRAEPGRFVLGALRENNTLWLAGATAAPRVWTLRLEEVLDEGFFTLTLWRDGLPIDGEHCPGTEIEEIFEGVARGDKPALEMARNGGFVARLETCHEQTFRVLKSVEGGRP